MNKLQLDFLLRAETLKKYYFIITMKIGVVGFVSFQYTITCTGDRTDRVFGVLNYVSSKEILLEFNKTVKLSADRK